MYAIHKMSLTSMIFIGMNKKNNLLVHNLKTSSIQLEDLRLTRE